MEYTPPRYPAPMLASQRAPDTIKKAMRELAAHQSAVRGRLETGAYAATAHVQPPAPSAFPAVAPSLEGAFDSLPFSPSQGSSAFTRSLAAQALQRSQVLDTTVTLSNVVRAQEQKTAATLHAKEHEHQLALQKLREQLRSEREQALAQADKAHTDAMNELKQQTAAYHDQQMKRLQMNHADELDHLKAMHAQALMDQEQSSQAAFRSLRQQMEAEMQSLYVPFINDYRFMAHVAFLSQTSMSVEKKLLSDRYNDQQRELQTKLQVLTDQMAALQAEASMHEREAAQELNRVRQELVSVSAAKIAYADQQVQVATQPLHSKLIAASSQRDMLQAELTTAQQQLNLERQRMAASQQQLADLNSELHKLQLELEAAHRDVNHRTESFKLLDAQYTSSERANAELRIQYTAVCTDRDELRSRLEAALKEKSGVQDVQDQLAQEIAVWKQRCATKDECVRLLESKVQRITEEQSAALTASENAEIQLQMQVNTIDALRTELSAAQTLTAEQATQLQQLLATVQSLQLQLSESTLQVQQLTASEGALTAQSAAMTSELSHLTAVNAEQEQTISSLQADVQRLTAVLASSREDLCAAVAREAQLQHQVTASDTQLQAAQATTVSMEAQVATLSSELAAATESLQQTQAELQTMSVDRDSLAQRLQHAETSLQQVSLSNSEIASSVTDKSQKLAQLQSELDNKSSQARRAEEALREAQQQISHLESCVSDANVRITQLQARVAQLVEDNKNLAATGDAQSEEISRLTRAEELASELRCQLDTVSGQRTKLQEDLTSALAMIDELQAAAQVASTEGESLQQQLGVANAELVAMSTRLNTVTTDLEAVTGQKDSAQQQVNELQVSVSDATACIAQLQAQVAQLQQDNKALDETTTARAVELISQVEQLTQAQAQLQQELTSMQTANKELQAAAQCAVSDCDALGQQLQAVKSELTAATARLSGVTADYEAVMTQSTELQSINQELRNQLSLSESSAAALRGKFAAVDHQLSEQESACTQLRGEVEELKNAYANAAEQLQTALQELAVSQQAAADSTNDAAAAHMQLAQMRDEYGQQVTTLEQTVELQRSHVQDLERQLKSLKADMELEQLASMQRSETAVAVALQDKQGEIIRAKQELSQQVARLQQDHQDAMRGASRQLADSQALVLELQRELATVRQALATEARRRKQAHNRVMELQGNIRVACRLRPTRSGVTSAAESMKLIDDDAMTVRIGKQETKFEFDRVFHPYSTQDDVYDIVQPMIDSVLDGYNACIFAYGQTGAGKTHTMQGKPTDPGVVQRAVQSLFAGTEPVSVKASLVEIYQEQIRDLLRGIDTTHIEDGSSYGKMPEDNEVTLREGKKSIDICGLTELPTSDAAAVMNAIRIGSDRRSVGSHAYNDVSSRSHMVVRLVVTRSVRRGDAMTTCTSVLNLVDLAGSERLEKTEATGQTLKEGQAINKSLSALGDVIAALRNPEGHVPFRNSKLTFLLKDCLRGDSKVLMFANVSYDEADLRETLSSLTFASRCRAVALGKARRNSSTRLIGSNENEELARTKSLSRMSVGSSDTTMSTEDEWSGVASTIQMR